MSATTNAPIGQWLGVAEGDPAEDPADGSAADSSTTTADDKATIRKPSSRQ